MKHLFLSLTTFCVLGYASTSLLALDTPSQIDLLCDFSEEVDCAESASSQVRQLFEVQHIQNGEQFTVSLPFEPAHVSAEDGDWNWYQREEDYPYGWEKSPNHQWNVPYAWSVEVTQHDGEIASMLQNQQAFRELHDWSHYEGNNTSITFSRQGDLEIAEVVRYHYHDYDVRGMDYYVRTPRNFYHLRGDYYKGQENTYARIRDSLKITTK